MWWTRRPNRPRAPCRPGGRRGVPAHPNGATGPSDDDDDEGIAHQLADHARPGDLRCDNPVLGDEPCAGTGVRRPLGGEGVEGRLTGRSWNGGGALVDVCLRSEFLTEEDREDEPRVSSHAVHHPDFVPLDYGSGSGTLVDKLKGLRERVSGVWAGVGDHMGAPSMTTTSYVTVRCGAIRCSGTTCTRSGIAHPTIVWERNSA